MARLGWLGLLALTACATPAAIPVPHAGSPRVVEEAEELLFAALPHTVRAALGAELFAGLALSQPEPGDASGFAAPHRLRPCCAFGHGLAVRVAVLPLPGFRLDNVLETSGLGRHRYDAALLALDNGLQHAFVSPERNGLVYTRRGGFVDLAHLRGYADWTVYLAHRVAAMLPKGGSLELPDEGGRRTLHLAALAPGALSARDRWGLAVAVAERVAWQLSLWHEAATWYGWSSLGIFPERVSAFSPEDLYSNALGIRVAGALLRLGGAKTRSQYEANMDAVLPQVLARLGAVSAECSRTAAQLVDRIWWDSRRRLPRPDVVLERNFHTGPELVPWRISLPERGHEPDPPGPLRPVVLTAPDRPGLAAAVARLEIEPEPGPARSILGARVYGRELRAVIRRVREEAQRTGGSPG